MKLRAWRAQKVLTQKDVAGLAGVSVSTVTAIERGKELPSAQTARKLASALGVEPLEIDEVKEAMARTLEGPKKDPVGASPTR
jgi:transcriptional regulator with XRE-family HTH domain